MHFVSAMDTVSGMRGILGLHETVCSGAADGYARMAQKPALTLLHLGPGLSNALANMHNARRAGSPMVNLIGDMATWHKGADPLLNMDIQALAGTVSKEVVACAPGDNLHARMTQACISTKAPKHVGGSRVCTLLVPHDLSWERSAQVAQEKATTASLNSSAIFTEEMSPEVHEFISDCAAALKGCSRGQIGIYIGGRAGLTDGDALQSIGRLAAALGAPIFCENAFARIDRGEGLPAVQRLPYFPQDAASTLAKFQVLLVVDARRPVATFGYEGGPSQLIDQPDQDVWEIDSVDVHIPTAVRMLASFVGGDAIKPCVNCGGVFAVGARPPLPKGRLNPASMSQIVAAIQPEGVIIVDESLTSGNAYWEASRGCPTFSHLTLTGGAIGCGPPIAVGAAIACPGRRVINLQADGSAMYSLQALWTQAREGLDVLTIVCANHTYAILKVEMAKQRIAPSNGKNAKALTEIGNPPIDWINLAQVGVQQILCLRCPTDEAETAIQKMCYSVYREWASRQLGQPHARS